ncbi:11098_t:CDS:2 [Acaulospora colombiana]|uniref:11098_t:CDS:1 n=1 Tax=Acaulospora colombiana TaxID=27376 RepID=A0ACA9LHJ5_9GLOM|nr:11098_t:CDS:2 [Acaulospora colombiana]
MNATTRLSNFLINATEEDITASSVIYQVLEEDPWIPQNELKSIVYQAVTLTKNLCEEGSPRYIALLEIFSEYAKSLNEDAYVSNVILPIIRATLQDLPFGKSTFFRRGDRRSGRRPNVMFVVKHRKRNYELLYVECSRTKQKEQDDEIRLWREANDEMYYVRKRWQIFTDTIISLKPRCPYNGQILPP